MTRRSQDERKADTRGRLLQAAATLFAEHGVDAVSVDAVAEAAQRTSGAVYAHFGSKQGLLLALLDEWKHSLVTLVAAEFELATDVVDRLRAVAANVIVQPSEDTRRLLLLERELWLRAARDPQIAEAMARRAAEAHEHMCRGFARWLAAGVVEPGVDAATLAMAFRAMVLGLAMQHDVDGGTDVEQATATLAALLRVPLPRSRRRHASNA